MLNSEAQTLPPLFLLGFNEGCGSLLGLSTFLAFCLWCLTQFCELLSSRGPSKLPGLLPSSVLLWLWLALPVYRTRNLIRPPHRPPSAWLTSQDPHRNLKSLALRFEHWSLGLLSDIDFLKTPWQFQFVTLRGLAPLTLSIQWSLRSLRFSTRGYSIHQVYSASARQVQR